MGTELGSASVKVSLNVEEAKRQIAELRKEIKQGGPSGGPTPDAPTHILKVNPRAGHPHVSGDLPDDPDLGNTGGTTGRLSRGQNVAQGLYQDIIRYMKIDRMRKFGQLHVQQAAQDASLAGRAGAGLSKAVGSDLPGALSLAGVVYAGVSALGHSTPYAMEALSQAGVPIPDAVMNVLNDFKNVINNLESRISNIVKAPKEALDMWAGGARITGQLPDFVYYWNQAYDVGVAEDDLNKKFDHFKRMEVAAAIGKGVGEVFQKSFDR